MLPISSVTFNPLITVISVKCGHSVDSILNYPIEMQRVNLLYLDTVLLIIIF